MQHLFSLPDFLRFRGKERDTSPAGTAIATIAFCLQTLTGKIEQHEEYSFLLLGYSLQKSSLIANDGVFCTSFHIDCRVSWVPNGA